MLSARLSSSFPSNEGTCNKRATIPSKKSKTAPNMIKRNAVLMFPLNAKEMAMHPDNRLQHVSVLGIFLNKGTNILISRE